MKARNEGGSLGWGPPVILPHEFKFLALLNKAAEQEGQEDEGNGAEQDLVIHPAPPSPEMAPIFKPESGTPSSRKRGSRGRHLAKQGGEVSLPHGEGAHPSGKGGGKRRNRAGKGHQSTHHHSQKLAKQAVASKHPRGFWVKAALSTKPTHVPLHTPGLPACSTGYTACTFNPKPTEYGLSDLIGRQAKFGGFTLVEWNGRCILQRQLLPGPDCFAP